ncbi:MAG: acyl-CoA dehydratase activase [bacterium]|nr:acyl-CoA dehydratase activase [bacterium]
MTAFGKVTAGVDIGSRTTKAIIWDGAKVLCRALISTGWTPEISADSALRQALESVGLKKVERTVVTGYGRVTASFADETITEITAHARGVAHLLPETHTLIDIGGQDSKAIILNGDGMVQDFAMNDRCAAGSGKFLEFLAHSMGLSVEAFSQLAYMSRSPVQISSICTVFAESEVLSLLAEGVAREDVANGVHRSIARRVAQMAQSLHPRSPAAFTGGVALNVCMVREMSAALDMQIQVPEWPEFTGALGAAIIAREGW